VTPDHIIGTYAYGEPVRASRAGMYVFPSAPDRLAVGKKIAWIAEEQK